MSRALPRTAALLAAPVLALALAGCGAGFEAQTYQERTVPDGTNATAGPISVRNATILPGSGDGVLDAGDDADVLLSIGNDGAEADRLVGASSPEAASVDVVEVDGGRTLRSLPLPALSTTGSENGLVLRSLADDLRPGEYVEVTLRFERAGEVTLQVPVALTGEYDEERERSENFHPIGEEGEH